VPKTAPATKSAPIASQPIAGRRYLQLSATSKDKAEVMADLIRRANLPGIAAAIPDRPDIYRVLVGPIADDAVESTRAKLNSSGFPGKDAIPKVF
jgi:cell division septation protein DedD